MNDMGRKVESFESEAGHWSQEEGRWGCRGISGQLAKDPRSKWDTRHVGSIVYLGVSLADFPAVFFHISHWYLSWNTAGGGDCI